MSWGDGWVDAREANDINKTAPTIPQAVYTPTLFEVESKIYELYQIYLPSSLLSAISVLWVVWLLSIVDEVLMMVHVFGSDTSIE